MAWYELYGLPDCIGLHTSIAKTKELAVGLRETIGPCWTCIYQYYYCASAYYIIQKQPLVHNYITSTIFLHVRTVL